MKIYAPVKGVNGIYASVRFVNGVGETDNPILISWFQSHGYHIVDESHIAYVQDNVPDNVPDAMVNLIKAPQNDQIEVQNDQIDEKPDFDNMTPLELREWAIANGLGSKIRNTRNKEKLLEIIRG